MGLTLQPYWSPGIREPGVEAKGAMIGFGDVHTRAHIYRAILEGLAYALRQGMEKIEKRSKVSIKRLRVAGGGSQSDAAMQLTADIFGLPAERPHVYEASGLGAAICCAVGLGLHADFPTAIAAMTRVGAVFMPRPEAQQSISACTKRSICACIDSSNRCTKASAKSRLPRLKNHHKSPVGVSLLAIALCQPTRTSTDPTLSRAGSLLQCAVAFFASGMWRYRRTFLVRLDSVSTGTGC
jgi:ribulose kinase